MLWTTRFYWNLSKLVSINPDWQSRIQDFCGVTGRSLKAHGLSASLAARVTVVILLDRMDMDKQLEVLHWRKHGVDIEAMFIADDLELMTGDTK